MTEFTDSSIYNNMGIEMAVVGIGAKNEHALDERHRVLEAGARDCPGHGSDDADRLGKREYGHASRQRRQRVPVSDQALPLQTDGRFPRRWD